MKLPPLNSLRVFEVVARYGSIRAAADHLGLSSSTISEHIKNLEYSVGVTLFQRKANALNLTDEGEVYAKAVRTAFETISCATDTVADNETGETLRLTCLPSIAKTWMPSVLTKFKESSPNISVECDFSPEPRDLLTDGFDAAIRYGSGVYDDAHVELLLTDKIAPVCSPQTSHWIKSPIDLIQMDRIECSEGINSELPQWDYWFANTSMASQNLIPTDRYVTKVNSTAFAVEVLYRSDCVAILDYNSVKKELLEGHLVCPLGGWIKAQNSYYFAYPKSKPLGRPAKKLKATIKNYIKRAAEPPD